MAAANREGTNAPHNSTAWLRQTSTLSEDAKSSMSVALNESDAFQAKARMAEAQMLATLSLAAATAAVAAATQEA